MPPRQRFTPRKWFLNYSERALLWTGVETTRPAARRFAERRWRETGPNRRARFEAACRGRKAVEDQIRRHERHRDHWEARWHELVNAGLNGAQDIQNVLALWDGWYERQQAVVDARQRLTEQSQLMKTALRDIYRTTVRMRTYARNRHREIENLEQAAIQQLLTIENAQPQVDRDIPRTAINEVKVPELWLPRLKLREKDFNVRTDFIQGRIPRGLNNDVRRWYGGWPIPHQGGHSRTGIWIGVNNHRNIIDRVVCKAVTESRHSFGDVSRWEHGTDGMRDNRQTILPMEVVCNEDLDTIDGTRVGQAVDVVGLRRYNVDIRKLTYTLYLDYCGRGDLQSLIERYNGEARELAPPPTEILPEPFIWRVFLALAVAGLAMQNGAIRSDRKDPEWIKEIVHRDLKPANVFLDESTDGHFDTYPTVRLGDFGIAVKTHRNDILNPTIFLNFMGTPAFAAPEQLAYADLRDCEPVDQFQQLSWTNVYAIGMTMLSMIILRFPAVGYAWGADVYAHDFTEAEYAPSAAHYSNDLVNLVQECLDTRPLHRITFPALLTRIEQAVDVYGDDLARGRQHKFIEDHTQHDPDRLWCPQDAYARALTLREMPEPAEF